MCKIINPHTETVVHEGTYAECVEYLRTHWAEFDRGNIDIIWASTGRYASFTID